MENNLLENNLELENKIENEVTIEKQNDFLESTLGKVINTGLDIGLRALLPDLIENQVIDIKDAILNGGFKEGLNEMIDSVIDLGKSAIGIFTGKFENVSQVQDAVRSGGIIDSTSNLMDWAVEKAREKEWIPDSIAKIIQQGKNIILNHVEKNVEEVLTNQLDSIENLEKYNQNWKNYYEQRDFTNMEKEYEKIQKELKKVIPLESTLTEAREIENIHQIIKNNGQNFDLTEQELELAGKLI